MKKLSRSTNATKAPTSGFTLVELLVVIAIMTILASLLLPAIKSARVRAEIAACAHQVRQIGSAFFMFAGDHYGRLPPGSARVEVQGGGWSLQIGPYLSGGQKPSVDSPIAVLHCPAHRTPLVIKNTPGYLNRAVGSYAAMISNSFELSNPLDPWPRQRVFLGWFGGRDQPRLVEMRPVSMIPAPSSTAMLTELAHDRNNQASGAALNNIDPFQIDPTSVGVQLGWANANNVTLTLHNGRVNYLFADGRVQSYDIFDPELYGSGRPDYPRGVWTVYPDD